MSGYFYLATPYTKYPLGPGQAFIDACKLTAKLVDFGIPIFSPIAHCHPVASFTRHDPLDSTFWTNLQRPMMEGAKRGLIVAKMDGWEESSGVKYEIEWFSKTGRPILYLNPNDVEGFVYVNLLKDE